MFLQALTTQVLAGVKLEDICLCDNFDTPHLSPGADYWLSEMVAELAELVDVFRTPLISGKDSSAGSVETPEGVINVPPAVFISALGKVPDAAKLLPNQWQSPGNLLVRIGPRCNSAAGTAAARHLHIDANDVDTIGPNDHLKNLQVLESARQLGTSILSGAPVGVGGTLATVVRGALASGYGVELDEPESEGVVDYFQEHRCGAIIEVPAGRDFFDGLMDIPHVADIFNSPQHPWSFSPIGRITDRPGEVIVSGTNVLTNQVIAAWRDSYREGLR